MSAAAAGRLEVVECADPAKFDETLSAHLGKDNVYALFVGAVNPSTGVSWCVRPPARACT